MCKQMKFAEWPRPSVNETRCALCTSVLCQCLCSVHCVLCGTQSQYILALIIISDSPYVWMLRHFAAATVTAAVVSLHLQALARAHTHKEGKNVVTQIPIEKEENEKIERQRRWRMEMCRGVKLCMGAKLHFSLSLSIPFRFPSSLSCPISLSLSPHTPRCTHSQWMPFEMVWMEWVMNRN